MIPRSIIAAVLFGAVFYVFCISGQVLGFGTGGAGVSQFAHSSAPLGDLARTYVGSVMAELLDVAAVLSSLGAALVGVTVASRTLYALARDRLLTPGIANVSRGTGAPIGAVTASMALTLVSLLAFGLAGTSALNAFFYLATIGTLSVLVVYVLVSASALRLELRAPGRKSWLAIVLPVGGAIVALYVVSQRGSRAGVPVQHVPLHRRRVARTRAHARAHRPGAPAAGQRGPGRSLSPAAVSSAHS